MSKAKFEIREHKLRVKRAFARYENNDELRYYDTVETKFQVVIRTQILFESEDRYVAERWQQRNCTLSGIAFDLKRETQFLKSERSKLLKRERKAVREAQKKRAQLLHWLLKAAK